MYIYSPIWGNIQNISSKNIYLKFLKQRYSLFSPISGILNNIIKNKNVSQYQIILEFISEGKKLNLTLYTKKDIKLFYELPMIVLIGQHLGEVKSAKFCQIDFMDNVYFLVEIYQDVVGGISHKPLALI